MWHLFLDIGIGGMQLQWEKKKARLACFLLTNTYKSLWKAWYSSLQGLQLSKSGWNCLWWGHSKWRRHLKLPLTQIPQSLLITPSFGNAQCHYLVLAQNYQKNWRLRGIQMEAWSTLPMTLGIFLLKSWSGILCVKQDTTVLWKTSLLHYRDLHLLWRQRDLGLYGSCSTWRWRERWVSVTLNGKALG